MERGFAHAMVPTMIWLAESVKVGELSLPVPLTLRLFSISLYIALVLQNDAQRQEKRVMYQVLPL